MHIIYAAALLFVLALTTTAQAKKRIVTTSSSIEIFGPLRFVGHTSQIDERTGKRMLDAVADALNGNPSIALVEVYATGADAPDYQKTLGQERANKIVEELVARGVARKRLIARGRALPRPGESAAPFFLIAQRKTDSLLCN